MDDAAKRAKELLSDIDAMARDVDEYSYGLPITNDEVMLKLAEQVAAAIREGAPAQPVPDALLLLSAMTDEARLEVFGHFCTYCGSTNPNCQCWNDE